VLAGIELTPAAPVDEKEQSALALTAPLLPRASESPANRGCLHESS
jgi:hypothetical protein